MRQLLFILSLSTLASLSSCTGSSSERGLLSNISIRIFEWVGVRLFDTDEQFALKDVHLDGAGLLNRDVFVTGKVEVVGAFGTFIVISEDQIRMLIDLSHLGGLNTPVVKGDTMKVIGKVQSGEKGHFYLVANAVSRG